MTYKFFHISLFYMVLLLALYAPAQSQTLQRLEITQISAPEQGVAVFRDYPGNAAIIIESPLTNLRFSSNVGGIVREMHEPDRGRYVLILEPYTQILVIEAPGFIQQRQRIGNPVAREIRYFEVKPKHKVSIEQDEEIIAQELLSDFEIENIIKVVDKRVPDAYMNREDTIIYTHREESDFLSFRFYVSVIQKISNNWISIYNVDATGDFDGLKLTENPIDYILIDDIKYFAIHTEGINHGSFYRGLTSDRVIFYNMQKGEASIVDYNKWYSDVTGRFSVEGENDLDDNAFVEYVSDIIEKKYGKPDMDLESDKNFHIKWQVENNNIYNLISTALNNHSWVDIVFSKISYDFFSQRASTNNDFDTLPQTNKYIATAGFVNPVMIYSKIEEEAYVLWVPANWPNGGAWGLRSFEVVSLIDDSLIVKNSNKELEFDLIHRRVRAKRLP